MAINAHDPCAMQKTFIHDPINQYGVHHHLDVTKVRYAAVTRYSTEPNCANRTKNAEDIVVHGTRKARI